MSALDAYVAHLQLRSIQDLLSAVSAQQRRRRAEEFRAARHRPGIDWPGLASDEELRRRWVELTEIARALDASSTLGPIHDVTLELVDVFQEAS